MQLKASRKGGFLLYAYFGKMTMRKHFDKVRRSKISIAENCLFWAKYA